MSVRIIYAIKCGFIAIINYNLFTGENNSTTV